MTNEGAVLHCVTILHLYTLIIMSLADPIKISYSCYGGLIPSECACRAINPRVPVPRGHPRTKKILPQPDINGPSDVGTRGGNTCMIDW